MTDGMAVIDRVIAGSGGVSALVEALGISPQAIHKWRKKGIPPERVVKLEELSGVPREELRPDLYRDTFTRIPSTVASRKRA